MLWMFQRVNYGPLTNEKNRHLPDLSPREWALMVPTIAMAIVMGVVPAVFLRPMEASVARVVERVNGSQPARVSNDPALHPPATSTAISPLADRRAGSGGIERAAPAAVVGSHASVAERRVPNAEDHE
jgi:NADH-quinone oxidoreductase subunit M